MTTTYADLLTRWQTDEGKPYKGSLIDWDAYGADPDNIGCFCAQGQALHLLAGWTPQKLRDVPQVEADAETAKLLNISRAHAVLLRAINDKTDGAPAIVLTDPGKVIGDQWSKLLDFWAHLDGLTNEQWDAAWAAARDAARAAAWDAAWAAAWAAARDAAGAAAWDAAWDAAWAAARAAAWDAAWAAARDAAGAAAEIQGADILCAQGRPFFFLPAFGFASPDDIPARPADYGIAALPPRVTQ
jgi:hypothetical protein